MRKENANKINQRDTERNMYLFLSFISFFFYYNVIGVFVKVQYPSGKRDNSYKINCYLRLTLLTNMLHRTGV